jgi:hypothetical protein
MAARSKTYLTKSLPPMFTPLAMPRLLELAQRSAAITEPCTCISKSLAGWEGLPVSLKESQLQQVASLVAAEEEDLTLDEYHPNGTHYWSANAPIAPQFFPYNRCGVWTCTLCSRHFLRYAEAGAYHIEQRIRSLDPMLIVDVPFTGIGRS